MPCPHAVVMQWMLRITQYADRLLEDLDGVDWSDSIKDMQRNWIGRSQVSTPVASPFVPANWVLGPACSWHDTQQSSFFAIHKHNSDLLSLCATGLCSMLQRLKYHSLESGFQTT